MVHDHNLTSTAGNFLTTIGLLEDKFAATEGWGAFSTYEISRQFFDNLTELLGSWIEGRDSWTPWPAAPLRKPVD